MAKIRFDILSPDGFGMFMGKTYSSPEKAELGFKEWIKPYEFQGYYSSNKGRISLDELRDCCKLVEIN
jgi:hypothetical protein